MRRSLLMAPLLALSVASGAGAEHLSLGAAVQRDIQRFSDEGVPNRLDGASTGWTAGAAIFPLRHLAIDMEWSDSRSITDTRTTSLDVDGRAVTIRSLLSHRTRSLAALAGYTHRPSARMRVAYLAGAAFTHARRTFSSNAPGLVLVRPSDTAASGRSGIVDRFAAFIGGIDAAWNAGGRLQFIAGARAQTLALDPDVSGWSVRTFIGAGWAF